MHCLFSCGFRLLQCKACLGLKDKAPVQEALAILLEVCVFCSQLSRVLYTTMFNVSQLGQVKSCDLHVTTCLVKAYLLQEDIQKASEVHTCMYIHYFNEH